MKNLPITISLDRAAYLERLLQTVLDQGHPELEYVVADRGSTDGSRDILECHRDRIADVNFDPDTGPTDAMEQRFAAAYATYSVISILML